MLETASFSVFSRFLGWPDHGDGGSGATQCVVWRFTVLCVDRLPIHSVWCGGSLCFVKTDFPFTVCCVAVRCAL